MSRQTAKGLLFHHRFTKTHVNRPFDLSQDQDRVDRTPDVVCDPDVHRSVKTGVGIDFDFDHCCRIGIGGRGPDARPLVLAGSSRRNIRTHAPQSAKSRLRDDYGFGKAQTVLWVFDIENLPVGKNQAICRTIETLCNRFGYELTSALCGLVRCVTYHQGNPRRVAS